MDELYLPITPSDASLQSHLAALDLLASRLSALTTRTGWPARIPLNAKASFSGSLIHTNDLKVNVGGEWWVDMTAEEATAYVGRRKNTLLMEHARLQEGDLRPLPSVSGSAPAASRRATIPPPVSFNALFRMPASAEAGPSKPRSSYREDTSVQTSETSERLTVEPELASSSVPEEKDATLADVLDDFMEKQRGLANGSGKGKDRGFGEGEPMVNEEGLPIHEIREDEAGRPLGLIPPSTGDPPVPPDAREEDYWGAAAVARRAALRRRVFHEGDETDEGEPAAAPDELPQVSIISSPPSSPVPSSPPRRLSSTSLPPRSILKPPTRKKSVSFDNSVPLPPDSPVPAHIGGTVFPVPAGEFEPRPVPVIHEPKPALRHKVGERGFAGFKRGFLGGPSKPTTLESSQTKGLIAQVISPTSVQPLDPSAREVKLPKMTQSKQMPSMKPSVVEKPQAPPTTPSPHTGVIPPYQPAQYSSDGDDDDDGFDDPSEEDECDLDDALLAREAALEYHRRRAHSFMRKTEGEDEEEGVMLGIPRIDGKQIVNPTPEDLRKFVRVGKLENGNLVLAPGEEAWSDGDSADGVDEGRRRRDEMKRRLMGLDVDVPSSAARPPEVVGSEVIDLPPLVLPAVKETPAPLAPKLVAAEPAPRKVSRFKAARMGT